MSRPSIVDCSGWFGSEAAAYMCGTSLLHWYSGCTAMVKAGMEGGKAKSQALDETAWRHAATDLLQDSNFFFLLFWHLLSLEHLCCEEIYQESKTGSDFHIFDML